MHIDVLAAPGELEWVELGGTLTVVIDAIRATTTLLAALEAGARRVHAVSSVEEALDLRRSIGGEDVVLCGERGGRQIEGFDLGNSPLEFVPEAVAGKILVCTTTNGTRTFRECEGAAELWLGCFRNRAAVVDRLTQAAEAAEAGPERVVIACAGKDGRLSLDDLLCAGLTVQGLRVALPDLEAGDGARAALLLADALGAPTSGFLASTAAGASLVGIGLRDDLDYCAALDVSPSVPALLGGGFRLPETSDGEETR
jgi:2-phosphosulfolactate phosphatase